MDLTVLNFKLIIARLRAEEEARRRAEEEAA